MGGGVIGTGGDIVPRVEVRTVVTTYGKLNAGDWWVWGDKAEEFANGPIDEGVEPEDVALIDFSNKGSLTGLQLRAPKVSDVPEDVYNAVVTVFVVEPADEPALFDVEEDTE